MEIDETLLSWAETTSEPITWLRFYSWSKPTISLGKHQKPESAVDLEVCRGEGVEIVWRPTGGRAVLHDCELTYSVVSNDGRFFPPLSIDRTYLRISQALKAGLRHLGAPANLAIQPHRQGLPFASGGAPCFATASRHEVLCRGRKLVGSAQRRLKRSFLQHGSVPIRLDWGLMSRLFRLETAQLRTRMIDLEQALSREVTHQQVIESLTRGFLESFHVSLERADPRLESTRSAVR